MVKWGTSGGVNSWYSLWTGNGVRGVSKVNSIHQLMNGQWVKIASMSSGRLSCLVVTPSQDKMMIVGGYGGVLLPLDSVKECVVM